MSRNFAGRARQFSSDQMQQDRISAQLPQGKQVPGGFLAEGIALPNDVVRNLPPVDARPQPIGAHEFDRKQLPQAPPFRGVLDDLQDRR